MSSIVSSLMSTIRMSWLAVAAIGALAACDHPTAPQVRDAVEAQQHALYRGTPRDIDIRLASLLEHISGPGWIPRALRSDTAVLEQDGNQFPLNATVIERVYLPPPDTHGRAYSRYTVVVWDNYRFQRGALFLTDDSVSDVALPRRELLQKLDASLARRRSIVMARQPDDERTFFGRDGHLEIHGREAPGACPFFEPYTAASLDLPARETSTRVDCTPARYSISLTTRLRAGDPNDPSAIQDLLGRYPIVHVDAPDIGGVRIVTHCPRHSSSSAIEGCGPAARFWRDSTQFAKQLAVDLSQMHSDGRDFWTQLARGDEKQPRSGMLAGPVHATWYRADGSTIRSEVITRPETTAQFRQGSVALSALDLRVGAKGRIVAPGYALGLGPEFLDYAVFDLEILPPLTP